MRSKPAASGCVSALPETWLVHLIRMAEDDPRCRWCGWPRRRRASASRRARTWPASKSAMLMQNHGFLASVNGIVSCAQLYRIPLLMLISHRGEFGERDPWQTEGGGVDRARAATRCGIPHDAARSTRATWRGGSTRRRRWPSRRAGRSRCCSCRDLMWEE